MSGGLALTFRALAASDNDAAADVLLAALDLPRHEIREQALVALLGRRSDSAERAILCRWPEISDHWKSLVAARTGWLVGAVSHALAGTDLVLFHSACDAAIRCREYEMIPLLLSAALVKADPRSGRASATLVQLAELLADEASGPRDYRRRRDPQLLKSHLLGGLEQAAAGFDQHQRHELVEAFLLLADRENATLKRILQAPEDRNFNPLAEVLSSSSRCGVQRLLLSFLDDPRAPLAALNLIARRRDVAFVRHLARKIGSDPSATVRANLRRIESIPWLAGNLALLDALHESEQAGAVHLVTLASLPATKALESVAYLLRQGKVAGRRAAARGLAGFSGPTSDQLVLKCLDDDDPQVRAAAAAQLRQRNIAGAIHRLLPLLDSPHQCEREAVQSSLDEFRFEPFLAGFDDLSEEARASAGPLVRRIDPLAAEKTRAELVAPARSRRRRGLEIAVALRAVAELIEPIVELLTDEDQYLRIDAIRALAAADACPAVRAALREALLDPHPLVQRAAEEALSRQSRSLPFGAEASPVTSLT